MQSRPRVVVVGAGLAGLGCAVELSTSAVDCTVLEASDAVGGRVRTDLVDGFRLDRGFEVPLHRRLARGFDADTHRRLVRSNWIRTVLWSARGGLAIAIAAGIWRS